MNAAREALERQRDLALRDLVDLEGQVAAGQLTEKDAQALRAGYEAEAASAMAALDAASPGPGSSEDPAPAGSTSDGVRPRNASRRLVYLAGLVAAVLVAVLVPRFVVDRPPGGFVTGNEVLEQPGPTPTTGPPSASRALDKIPNRELEAVVEANPEVVGMRLALARRYADDGRLDLAAVHYTRALKQEPENGKAQAGLAGLLLTVGDVEGAQRLVEQALANDPELLDGLWVQANLLLHSLDDPTGALESLEKMIDIGGLPPEVQRQVDQLRAEALDREEQRR